MSSGLYVHIPFCVRKCLYCDFYSGPDMTNKKEYCSALLAELREYDESFDTVFIGGGTPTAIGEDLVSLCRALPKAAEFTVEANPGTLTHGLLRGLREAGVNRLSLGVQSFNDNELKALGRIHTAAEAEQAFIMAREAGFNNISIDLMLATPGQTAESLGRSLKKIAELSPEHVSAYSLIVEEGTPFYENTPPLPSEDEERELYWQAVEFLDNIGIKQYEISNFARPGRESRHNLKYWSGEPYVGIGAAAASYHGGYRYRNAADINIYLRGEGRGIDREAVSPSDRLHEKFWLGLRRTAGVEYNGEFPEAVDRLIKSGLLEMSGSMLRLTRKGLDLANVVFSEFV
ncbi:MAG: radical SAM family heme chaperone HemW [Oscillospiraceae bacterium]|nr:radical SAM family heme chaperone HemW [Oscillospiraceae bacterium]